MGQVSLRGIRKNFGDVPVIQGVDLEVRDGELLKLLENVMKEMLLLTIRSKLPALELYILLS